MDRRDILTKVIVGAMIKKGYLDIRSMHRNAANARARNEKLLFSILNRNKDTEYGRKYRFGEIRSIDDYRRMVPVTDYHAYEEYIDRMVFHGETNLITSRKVVGYAQSSGTVGGRKYLPLTQPQINVYTKHTVTRMMACADSIYAGIAADASGRAGACIPIMPYAITCPTESSAAMLRMWPHASSDFCTLIS